MNTGLRKSNHAAIQTTTAKVICFFRVGQNTSHTQRSYSNIESQDMAPTKEVRALMWPGHVDSIKSNLFWGKPSVFFKNRRFSKPGKKPSILVSKQKEIQIFHLN